MNNEQLLNNLKTTLSMEWYGIRIEDTKEIGDAIHQYISVPESSTIVTEDEELNGHIKTADGLIAIAKNMLVKMVIDTFKAEYGEDDEFLEDFKNDVADYIKVFAKVRKGEVWTKEMGDARVKEVGDEIVQASEYKEV